MVINFQPDQTPEARIPSVNPGNCPSSHGVKGFLDGTVYDPSLGVYVCPCGRQYMSDMPKPDTVTTAPSYLL